jgi:putative exporter of polyketide antibiotics
VAGVAVLTLSLGVLGIFLFVRRDLGARTAVRTRVTVRGRSMGLGLGGLFRGRWTLRGPGRRAVADRLPEAIGWGLAMGAYGMVVAFSKDTFKQVFESLPQIAQMVRTFYPEFSFESVGSVLQFAIFAFIALIVGLAAASLVHGWSSDERERRLEVLLSAPVARAAWALRSGGAVLLALLVMGLFIGLGPFIGAAVQGQLSFDLIGGGLVLGLYGAALAGFGLLVGGLGRPSWAALAVGAATLGFYLLDLLGAILRLPADFLNLSLSHHLGRPMAGVYDIPGMVACAAIAAGGLVFGAVAFSRRDLRAS